MLRFVIRRLPRVSLSRGFRPTSLPLLKRRPFLNFCLPARSFTTSNEKGNADKPVDGKTKTEEGEDGGVELTPEEMKTLDISKFDKLSIEDMKMLAANDNVHAAFLLGMLYYKGQGEIKRDAKQCLLYLSLAAEKGHAGAQSKLANIHMLGYGSTKNLSEAVRMFTLAAKQGDVEALGSLGFMYLRGIGVKADQKEAIHWLEKAANGGHVRAQTAVGTFYLTGNGVEKDEQKALHFLEKAAAAGHAEAQCMVGVLYTRGGSIQPNPEKAYNWLVKAAEQGDLDAQANLGELFLFGQIDSDKADDIWYTLKQAFHWYKQAAEQGHARAQLQVGFLYFHGLGVEKDLQLSAKWIGNAAEAGLVDAYFMMGYFHASGAGGSPNPTKAKEWFQRLYNQIVDVQKAKGVNPDAPQQNTNKSLSLDPNTQDPAQQEKQNQNQARLQQIKDQERTQIQKYYTDCLEGIAKLIEDPKLAIDLIPKYQEKNQRFWHGGVELLFKDAVRQSK